jgi:hypothetical protein
MIVDSDQCKSPSLKSLSCVWVGSESPRCKTRKLLCDYIIESKEWCESEGSVEGDIRCIWLEGNEDMEFNTKCMDEV